MSYYVSLTSEASRRLSAWKFPPHVIRAILQGLDELRLNPSDKLIRVGPPSDAMEYDLLVPDPADPGRSMLIVFSARYSVDEETLFLFDCHRLSGDQVD